MLITLLLTLTLAVGCGGTDGAGDGSGDTGEGDNGGDNGTNYDDYVFGGDIIPVMVIDRSIDTAIVNSLYSAISSAAGTPPDYVYSDEDDIPEEGAHEIVIGDSDRTITRKAARKLKELEHNTEYDVAYVIYASAGSVAIVYDNDAEGLAMETAIAKFTELCLTGKTELRLTSGVVYEECFSALEYYDVTDKEYYEWAWARLKEEAGGGEVGDAIVEAYKKLYAVFTDDMASWLANLYDPGVGGFYYSNSARDNGSYAPDTESTCQALGLVSGFGSVRTWRTGENTKYSEVISETRKNEIIVYVKSLQDENGFFYNYQWDKTTVDAHQSRRARDLTYSLSVLNVLGAKPTYDTPTGVRGDGIVVEGTYDRVVLMNAPLPVGTSAVVAVSKVVSAASYADHLENQDTLKAYLLAYEKSTTSFYSIGNTITSQMTQILARDKELKGIYYKEHDTYDGYESFATIIIDWFNKHQDPETGLWGHGAKQDANYGGVNGLLKISGIYNKAGAEIPNAEKAAQSAIYAIALDEKPSSPAEVYNTWQSVDSVMDNLRQCGVTLDVGGVMMDGNQRADAILAELYKIAAPAIEKTADKLRIFKRDDGSFSYTELYSSSTSQGMPVAVPGTIEGDVNATALASQTVGSACSALGFSTPAIYSEKSLCIFLNTFENLDPVIKKNPVKALDDEPLTFDNANVGDDTCDMAVNMASGGLVVEKDTRPGRTGNTIRVTGYSGAGGDIFSRNNAAEKDVNCAIFEAEICVHSSGTTADYIFQISMGSSYMFDIVVEKNEVLIRESTATSWSMSRYTDIARVPVDTWFKLRIEFYRDGYKGEQRTKIYINDVLAGVTNGFLGMTKDGEGTPTLGTIGSTRMYKMKGVNIDVSFDNVITTSKALAYEIANDPEGKLTVNVDKDVKVDEEQ